MKSFYDDVAKVKTRKMGLILFTFFGIYLISFTIYPVSGLNKYLQLSTIHIIFDIIATLILAILIVELHLIIDRKLNRVLPWNRYVMRRWILQTLVQIILFIILIVIYFILTFLIIKTFNLSYDQNYQSEKNDLVNFVSLIILLVIIVGMLNTVAFLSSSWKEQIITTAEYKTKVAESKHLVAQTELKALRLQLDSHFVFNNLSVLSELILRDQHLGFEYSENFSKVYRYLLINSKKTLITLGGEMNFLHSYLFLLKSRMGKGVEFFIEIDNNQMDLRLPPITLQLLVENAIKHNKLDRNDPLKIKIFSSQSDEITIENPVKPLLKIPNSSGLGLTNIISRYSLLSDRIPQITQENGKFIVKIPLLK